MALHDEPVTGSASFRSITNKSLHCLVPLCTVCTNSAGGDREQKGSVQVSQMQVHRRSSPHRRPSPSSGFFDHGPNQVCRRGNDDFSQLQPLQAYLERTVKFVLINWYGSRDCTNRAPWDVSNMDQVAPIKHSLLKSIGSCTLNHVTCRIWWLRSEK